MNHPKCFNCLPGLVRLEMTYQVPANVPADLRCFCDPFLHAVLAELARTRINRLLNCRWTECLGDGDEGYVFGISAGALGRLRDLFADSRKPLSNLFRHRVAILSAAFYCDKRANRKETRLLINRPTVLFSLPYSHGIYVSLT